MSSQIETVLSVLSKTNKNRWLKACNKIAGNRERREYLEIE